MRTVAAGKAAYAPVDCLPLKAGVGGLDLGDDVASCELGGTAAPLQSVDGIKDCFSTARAAIGEPRAHRRHGDTGPVDGVVAVRIV